MTTLQKIKLSSLSVINPPKRKVDNADSEVGFVPMECVSEVTGTLLNTKTVPYSKVSKGFTSFINGDVIFAKITPCMENGKCAVVENMPNDIGFGSTEFYVIRPNVNVSPEYLWLFLRQKEVRKSAVLSFTGASGHKRVPKNFIENIEVPIPVNNGNPDINLQDCIIRKIEELFYDIDKSIELQLKEIKKYEQLFLSSLRLTFNENNLKEFSLEQIASTTSGGTPNRSTSAYYGGNIPWLKSGELNDNRNITEYEETISEEGLKNSNAKLFSKGTLLLAMYGATAGKLGILGIESSTNQAICGITPFKHVSTNYLYWYLYYIRPEILSKAFGGAQPNISQNLIRNLLIKIPCSGNLPDTDKQELVVKKLEITYDQCQSLTRLANKQIENLEKLKQSLLSQAFKGELL